MMREIDNSLITEFKEYWKNTKDLINAPKNVQIVRIQQINRYPQLREYIKMNSYDKFEFIDWIDEIFEYFMDPHYIENRILEDLKVINIREYLSRECCNAILEECDRNLENFDLIKFRKKYPIYYKEIVNDNMRENFWKLDVIQSNELKQLIRAILPHHISEDIIEKKFKNIKYYYAMEKIDKFSGDDTEEDLIKMVTDFFNIKRFFNNGRVGFPDRDLIIFKTIMRLAKESYNLSPNIRKKILKEFKLKEKRDFEDIILNEDFENFRNYDKYISFIFRTLTRDFINIRTENLENIKKMLNVSKKFNLKQLEKIEIFHDIVIEYIYNYNVAPNNKEKLDFISKVFEVYLSKCRKPKDLLDKTISTIMSLMNTDFLNEEDRNKLKDVFNKVYLKRFSKRDSIRKKEICVEFPKLRIKTKKMELLTDKEYKMLRELACIERTRDGFFKEEYIDSILQFELNKNIDNLENSNFLKRLLEDKAQSILRKNNINNFDIMTVNQDYFIDGIVDKTYNMGMHNIDGRICINSQQYDDEGQTIINMLSIIMHEVQHAVQFNNIATQSFFNYLIYDMAKEYEIRKIYGARYYKDNYWKTNHEVDARIAENIKLVSFLQKIGINDDRIIKIIHKTIQETIIIKKDKIRKVIDENNKYFEKPLDILFQDAIRKKPQIISRYAPWKIEFDEKTGQRKGNLQILTEYVKWSNRMYLRSDQIVVNEYESKENEFYGDKETGRKQQISDRAELYVHIIKNDSNISEQEIIKDMLILPNLLDTGNYRFDILRDYIVKREILPFLNYYLFSTEIFSEQKLKSFNKGVSNLEKYARTINNKELKEEILKVINKIRQENQNRYCNSKLI